jgi:hypothetical protein
VRQKIFKVYFHVLFMKALLFHFKRYGIKIEKLSNRPEGIVPEKIGKKRQGCRDCIVVMLTVEKDDKSESIEKISSEIVKMSKEVGDKNVVILPFAHLSRNLAPSSKTIDTISKIEDILGSDFNIIRGHFGSHKSLLLDVYGHPGNARWREA